MTKNHQLKLHNRFDQFQICHVFTQATHQYLQKSNKVHNGKFYLKCLLGFSLAINAYLSHWGPWKWPSNYYLIVFSIFFYYIGSHLYSNLSPIDVSSGNLVGQFDMKDGRRIVIIKISQNKMQYIAQILDSNTKKSLGQKSFTYYQYFMEDGKFLQELYLKHLSGFLASIK